MWPILLDMTKVECKRMLRRLELEAYGNVVSALRAQGGLSTDKHKLLKDMSTTLNIPQERHRAEVRRAVNDERLATIAYSLTGDDSTDEWAIEGRRLVPLMPRMVPQTAYSVIADDEANKASMENDKLPHPAATERKRPLQTTSEPNKNIQYATSEFPSKHPNPFTVEETTVKKRKSSMNMEGSTLAQHLIMGPPKISRVQQLYRQKTKAILKQQMKQRVNPQQHITNVQKSHRKVEEDTKNIPQHPQIPISKQVETKTMVSMPVSSNNPINNENVATTSKVGNIQVIKPITSTSNTTKVQTTPVVVNATEIQSKSIKICPARKVITTTPRGQNQSQKLIIVSNSQGNTTSSILQRTLTIPFKTISMKNFDKLKVINTSTSQNIGSTTTTVNQKPKLLTVHTKVKSNTPGKQINIPFIQGVQLQALQNKGAIKMVPLSSTTKITSKSGIVNTSGSVYIMNSNAISAVTASNPSPIMTPKPQTSIETEPQRNVIIIKNEDIKPVVSLNENSQNVVVLNVQPQKEKSSVLSDILKASGVIPDESEVEEDMQHCDIETQISQLTEIPVSENEHVKAIQHVNVKESFVETEQCIGIKQIETSEIHDVENVIVQEVSNVNMQQVENVELQDVEDMQDIENSKVEGIRHSEIDFVGASHEHQEIVQYENIDEITAIPESTVEESNYVILEEGTTDNELIVCELEDQGKKNAGVIQVVGNLDPETGMYSIQETTESTDNQQTDSFVIEMESIHETDLDMPTLLN